jgi:hypothetical protein
MSRHKDIARALLREAKSENTLCLLTSSPLIRISSRLRTSL